VRRLAAVGRLLPPHRTAAESAVEREQASSAFSTEFSACPPSLSTTSEHQAVRRAREYLHAHLSEEITLRDLARISGLSMHWLAHVFKVETGLAPHSYQIQLRVLHAKTLLAAGWPIADAAIECGFYDQAHLTVVFKRHVGVTPGVYARNAVAFVSGREGVANEKALCETSGPHDHVQYRSVTGDLSLLTVAPLAA
jgi:AraC-like DNA-binding protein